MAIRAMLNIIRIVPGIFLDPRKGARLTIGRILPSVRKKRTARSSAGVGKGEEQREVALCGREGVHLVGARPQRGMLVMIAVVNCMT